MRASKLLELAENFVEKHGDSFDFQVSYVTYRQQYNVKDSVVYALMDQGLGTEFLKEVV